MVRTKYIAALLLFAVGTELVVLLAGAALDAHWAKALALSVPTVLVILGEVTLGRSLRDGR
jgi:hypothetical protein